LAPPTPRSGEDLDKDGMVQFPAIIGGTVPVINLEGFKPGELRVTGPVLAEMFLGKISKWNDPKLVALNPGKTLPDQNITVVHRADGSGTTFNWTDYLTKSARSGLTRWARVLPSNGRRPTSVGGKGNEGVAANVSRIKGAIGYVEYAYVKKNKMNFMQLQNRRRQVREPGRQDLCCLRPLALTGSACRAWAISMVNAKGESWPISTARRSS
jgi:phosphate transport system substrate-binding protein